MFITRKPRRAKATHGHGGIAHWIMGRVTKQVLEMTKLPLLIVRPSQVAVYLAEEKRDTVGSP